MCAGNYELERLIFSQHLPVSIEARSVGLSGHAVVMQSMVRVVCLRETASLHFPFQGCTTFPSDISEESAFLCWGLKITIHAQVSYKLRQRVAEISSEDICFSFMYTYTLSHRV